MSWIRRPSTQPPGSGDQEQPCCSNAGCCHTCTALPWPPHTAPSLTEASFSNRQIPAGSLTLRLDKTSGLIQFSHNYSANYFLFSSISLLCCLSWAVNSSSYFLPCPIAIPWGPRVPGPHSLQAFLTLYLSYFIDVLLQKAKRAFKLKVFQ